MAFKWPAKDPNEREVYAHNWAARLDDGEAIVGLPTATVDTGDVVVDSSTLFDVTKQRVWLSGGTVKPTGDPEKLTLRINTTSGRILDEGIVVTMKQR